MASSSRHLLTGQVLGFIPGASSPYQFLSLRTAEGDRVLKLSKDLRRSLFLHLEPGTWVRVLAKEKWRDSGPELKAKEVVQIAAPGQGITGAEPTPAAPRLTPRPKAQVLICQKSGCRKRGSAVVAEALEAAIAALPCEGVIVLKATGCMDRCKAGPNVVFMPDKARYSHVTPAQIPTLVERHLTPHIPSPDSLGLSPNLAPVHP